MWTPPRHTGTPPQRHRTTPSFSFTSPPSIRLVRAAPTPLHVPPYILSPQSIIYSDPDDADTQEVRRDTVPFQYHAVPTLLPHTDPFEFDIAPIQLRQPSNPLLEALSTEQIDRIRATTEDFRRRSSADSVASLPFIYDRRGTLGNLARDLTGLDVPEEMESLAGSPPIIRRQGAGRGFLESILEKDRDHLPSPREYMAFEIPRKVLVEFRDVFGASESSATIMDAGPQRGGHTDQDPVDGVDPFAVSERDWVDHLPSSSSLATLKLGAPLRYESQDSEASFGSQIPVPWAHPAPSMVARPQPSEHAPPVKVKVESMPRSEEVQLSLTPSSAALKSQHARNRGNETSRQRQLFDNLDPFAKPPQLVAPPVLPPVPSRRVVLPARTVLDATLGHNDPFRSSRFTTQARDIDPFNTAVSDLRARPWSNSAHIAQSPRPHAASPANIGLPEARPDPFAIASQHAPQPKVGTRPPYSRSNSAGHPPTSFTVVNRIKNPTSALSAKNTLRNSPVNPFAQPSDQELSRQAPHFPAFRSSDSIRPATSSAVANQSFRSTHILPTTISRYDVPLDPFAQVSQSRHALRPSTIASDLSASHCTSSALIVRPDRPVVASPPALSLDDSPQKREERDVSVAESFATFGVGSHRRPTTEVGIQSQLHQLAEEDADEDEEHEEGWTYSLSAYGSDTDSPQPKRRSSEWSFGSERDGKHSAKQASSHALSPFLERGSLSSAADTELVTPCTTKVELSKSAESIALITPRDADDDTPTRTLQPDLEKGKEMGYGLGLCVSPKSGKVRMKGGYLQIGTPRSSAGQQQIPRINLPVLVKPTVAGGGKMEEEIDDTKADAVLKAFDQTLTLQLLVDQESTREYRSNLRYRKTIKPRVFRAREAKNLETAAQWQNSPSPVEIFQRTGCVEFGMNPKTRDRWTFIHATLERLPVLRRVSVNDDEQRDYLSRGITMKIRDTGVYAVQGSEDKGRVEWKFEYLVQSRLNHMGEDVNGEKVVIPLAFYVSPDFFNADRAANTYLFNIVKKKVSPNLLAEKIRPRGLGQSPVPSTSPIPPSIASTTSVVSRAVGAIYDVFTSHGARGGATPTETPRPSPTGFGNSQSRPGSRQTAGGNTPLVVGGQSQNTENLNLGSTKDGRPSTRKRAASLFSRSRPVTQPSMAEVPVPKLPNQDSISKMPTLKPMKSLSSLNPARNVPSTAPPPPVPPLPSLSSHPHSSLTSGSRKGFNKLLPPRPATASVLSTPTNTAMRGPLPAGAGASSRPAGGVLRSQDPAMVNSGMWMLDRPDLTRAGEGQKRSMASVGGSMASSTPIKDGLLKPSSAVKEGVWMGGGGRRRPNTAQPRF